ncbi:MAG: trypsin-like peptidase domain-containing protein [Bryobacteraceae bacterium]
MIPAGAQAPALQQAATAQEAQPLAEEHPPPALPPTRSTMIFRELSNTLETISSQSGRAVVQIFARGYTTNDESSNTDTLLTSQRSSGSGVVITPDGFILTNAHVVKGARNLRVELLHQPGLDAQVRGEKLVGRSIPARVIGVDRQTDLAVIKIDRENLPYLEFGDSNSLKQGQLVLALGNPLGLENSVSLGVVSAVARQLKPDDPVSYIQTDAPINPGNSGGPLIDADGRVVGINTLILTQSGGSEGIGFAIPSNLASRIFRQLKTIGHVHRLQLGLVVQTISPAMADGLSLQRDRGVIVSDVEPDGPAAKAGIQTDDIIVAMNGKLLESAPQLDSGIFRQAPGETISLQILRGEQTLDIKVAPVERPEQFDALADLMDPAVNVIPQLGIVGLDVTKAVLQLLPDLRRPSGVVVAAHVASSPYSGPTLETGDVIYAMNRKVVSTVVGLRAMLDRLKAGDAVVLLVEREGKLIYVSLELE